MSLFSFLCSSNANPGGDKHKKPRRRPKHSLDSDLDSIISPIVSPATDPVISAPIPSKLSLAPVANSIRDFAPETDARFQSWSWLEDKGREDEGAGQDRGFTKSLHSQRQSELTESYQEAKRALLSSTPGNPANLRMTVMRDAQAGGPSMLCVTRGQRVRVTYKLGEWLWAELKSGEGGFVPYSHCRLSKKHYCTPIPPNNREQRILTRSHQEDRRCGVDMSSHLRASSPRRLLRSSSHTERVSLPQEMRPVTQHRTLLGAKLGEYTPTFPDPDASDLSRVPLLDSRRSEKRRPSLFSGYKHTYTTPGSRSNQKECRQNNT